MQVKHNYNYYSTPRRFNLPHSPTAADDFQTPTGQIPENEPDQSDRWLWGDEGLKMRVENDIGLI